METWIKMKLFLPIIPHEHVLNHFEYKNDGMPASCKAVKAKSCLQISFTEGDKDTMSKPGLKV